jgi:ABC-type lipoprotein release transport system permease subunit
MSSKIDAEEAFKGCAVIFLVFALVILLGVYSTAAVGFVISVFWAWFLMPIFPMLPHLTVIQAIGITFLLNALKPNYKDMTESLSKMGEQDEDAQKKIMVSIFVLIFSPWAALLAGFLFRYFFMN